MKDACESCLMPFRSDPGQRESEKYRSQCFKGGKFTYEGDLKEFQKMRDEGMRSRGMNPIQARIFTRMIRFAPRWMGK